MNRIRYVLFLSVLMLGDAMASTSVIEKYVSEPEVVGKSKLTYLFWDVYNATLYAPGGEYLEGKPFALTLEYLRDFEGESIAVRSAKEIHDQKTADKATIESWTEVMKAIFPDVKKGQTITGVVDNKLHSHFYLGDELLGSVEDEKFSASFFGIWLSDKTSEPRMRDKLLGS